MADRLHRRGHPHRVAAGFDEATRRDPAHTRDWIALIVDGNNTQIDAITAQAATRGVDVTILVDYLHVAGYVWNAAKAFFCTDTTAGRPWPAPGSTNAAG